MLLFHKRDLLVTLTLDDGTVTFSKPVKEILKYQHRYNYKFKLYETGKVTVADDYIIEGETLTVFFGSAYVEYSSSGATYNEGGSGGSGGDSGEGGECNCQYVTSSKFDEYIDGSSLFIFYYLDLLPEDTELNKIYFMSVDGVYSYVKDIIPDDTISFFYIIEGSISQIDYFVFERSQFDFLPDLPESYNELEGKWVYVSEQSIIG